VSYSVIVAEDEGYIRRSIVRKIVASTLPFHVIGEAEDGLRAIELVHQLGPDLLVTDIRMPEQTGIAVAGELKAEYPTLQVIIVTGYGEFEYAREAIRSGVSDFLVKPVDPVELEGALRRVQDVLDSEFAATDGRIRHEAAGRSRPPKEVIAGLARAIGERVRESISVAQLAEEAGYSPDHLTRLVARQTGMTTAQFIASVRIREAMRLLRVHRDLPIAEIGELVGLCDPAHFSRTFKKVTGTSPGEYRRRVAMS
jgi:two-component system, response regulator YesN